MCYIQGEKMHWNLSQATGCEIRSIALFPVSGQEKAYIPGRSLGNKPEPLERFSCALFGSMVIFVL
jgi:hypothetical protein